MFVAYFDGSATHPDLGPPTVTVAGYLWRFRDWKKLQREWRRLLNKYGLAKEPGYFRMAHFESRKVEPYANWPEEKREQALNEFLGAIISTAIYGVGVGVLLAHHDALEPELKSRIPSPYRLAASTCMGGVGNLVRGNWSGERIDYIFELGDEGQREMRAQIRVLMESPTWKEIALVQGVHFQDKRDVPALQPADILAYETMKEAQLLMGYLPVGRKDETRYPLRVLLESNVPHQSVLFDSVALNDFATRIRSPSDTALALREAIEAEMRRPKRR